MPNPNFGNIQYKASNGLIKLDELEGIVECFVSGIGNKDSVGDICATGAFAKSLQRRKPRVVWGHNWNDPIGKVLEIYEVPASDPRLPMKMKMAGIGGLYAKVQFNLQSEKGKEAFANVAFFGEEQEWSIGYKTLRAQFDENLQANVLYEVELYEVSPVLHGANQLTGTISVKSDEEKMHGMMPMAMGAPTAPEPRRDGIFDEGVSQRISGQQLAGIVAELSRRAAGPVMVVEATENSVVFVKPGKGKFRIGYHFTGSEYMFGKPELIQAEQPKPMVQSGPSPMQGISGKPSTNNPAMAMPVAMKPGNGGMIMVPLTPVQYEGSEDKKKPELGAEESELAESLVRIAGKYGKFDEDGDGIWAGYYPPAENKVKDIGVKCSNCVLYLGEGKCKILDLKVEDEGKCRFAIIPDGVVVGFGKKEYSDILDDEEIKMIEDVESKYPGEFILGAFRNTVKKRRKKRRSYKTLEEWGTEEQELEEKGLDPFLAHEYSYVIPVNPEDAFEFKSMIDPVLDYHRIDTVVNEYGIVINSPLNQESKDAISTATASAYSFLKKKIASEDIEEKALGRRIAGRAIDRPNIGGKKRRGGRGMGIPSGDLDPRTRRDSNLDGTLFDNVPGWEQPDPTPSGPGSIDNPKPSKRQLADAKKPGGKEKLSSGKRNERRHADRSADMEKQFPNAEENQKRADHEAIAKTWEDQGLGWEEVPRYNADKNLSSDYLRGREIGVNQARVMWDGDSVKKRPAKFNEKKKASQEYSNWYSSYAKSVSAYIDAYSKDDSENWDGIESALRDDVKVKYPDTQDWAKEDIATLGEYLNDIGLSDGKLSSGRKAPWDRRKPPEVPLSPRLQKLKDEMGVGKDKPRRREEPKASLPAPPPIPKAATEKPKRPSGPPPIPGSKNPRLSSGSGDRTRDPVNGGFLSETDYNDPDSGYGLVPKLMKEIGFEENEARDAMDNWNSLDDDQMKEFEDARKGDTYGAISDAWEESQAAKPSKGKLSDKEEMDAADESLQKLVNGFDGWDDEEWEFDNQLDGAVERWASANEDMPWINLSVEEMIDEMSVDESVEGQNKLAFLENLQQSLFDAQYRARSMSDDEMSRDRLERSVRRSQNDFDDGILSSGKVEWTKTGDGVEMDAPDIDGVYQIQGSNKEGFVVTRYSDARRNGGQDGQEYEHDRVFKSRDAAKKWAEKDYDKIIENMSGAGDKLSSAPRRDDKKPFDLGEIPERTDDLVNEYWELKNRKRPESADDKYKNTNRLREIRRELESRKPEWVASNLFEKPVERIAENNNPERLLNALRESIDKPFVPYRGASRISSGKKKPQAPKRTTGKLSSGASTKRERRLAALESALKSGDEEAQKAILKEIFRGQRYMVPEVQEQFGERVIGERQAWLGKEGNSYTPDTEITDEELADFIKHKFISDMTESIREGVDPEDISDEDSLSMDQESEGLPYINLYDRAIEILEEQNDGSFDTPSTVEEIADIVGSEELLFDALQREINKRKKGSERFASGVRKLTADDIDDATVNTLNDWVTNKEIYDATYGEPSEEELDSYAQGFVDGGSNATDEDIDRFYEDTEFTDRDYADFINGLPDDERKKLDRLIEEERQDQIEKAARRDLRKELKNPSGENFSSGRRKEIESLSSKKPPQTRTSRTRRSELEQAVHEEFDRYDSDTAWDYMEAVYDIEKSDYRYQRNENEYDSDDPTQANFDQAVSDLMSEDDQRNFLLATDEHESGPDYDAYKKTGPVFDAIKAKKERDRLSSGRSDGLPDIGDDDDGLEDEAYYRETERELTGALTDFGSSENEARRVLENWYDNDGRQDGYLAEYRRDGDDFSTNFARAATAMYQDDQETFYDNRQSRNLSSGRTATQEERKISDREIFERRMAGETLAETASALGMKREDVRQAELRHIARQRGTLQKLDLDDLEAYREDQARMAAEEAAELSFNEAVYDRRMGGESLAETAKALGMTREQVRRIEQTHLQLLRDQDKEANYWLSQQDGDTLGSGKKEYVSPIEEMNPGQRLSSGKLDEVYRSVQEQLIEQIQKAETEGGKWEFPWHRDASLPRNAMNSNRPYSGINSLMLMFRKDAMGYETGLWAGFNQWKEKGGTVRKGEKGTMIIIPTIIPGKKDADGNEVKAGSVFFKTGHVFNLDQIDGIDKEQFKMPELSEEERVDELEKALSEVGAIVNHGGDRAFYRPSTDEITLPPFSSFKSKEAYYAVFAHELMHWTGHKDRLNRDHLGDFGSPEYAQEELVAEIASAFFMTAHGLTPEPREDHAQYLASWLKKLKSDPDALKNAFEQAQKAHDFAISKSPSMSKKLGKKVAEAGVLPGNGDSSYGGVTPSLSSGARDKYIKNIDGSPRTLADELDMPDSEVLNRFKMRKPYRDGDRSWYEAPAYLGNGVNQWNMGQDDSGEWFAELMFMDGIGEDDEIDWDVSGVSSDGFKSPADLAQWTKDYEDIRFEWQSKFKKETDIEKIDQMLNEEMARRDAEYADSLKISRARENRQEFARTIAAIDESRLDWSSEDWADEAADIMMEFSRENDRLSSGVRSRYDDTPVEEIGTVTNALRRTDEAGSNSRYIASRLASVPADKYDFDSIRRNGESVSFTYGGKPRTLYPTGMMAKKGGGIYVVGLDDEAGQYRSFSLSKIEGLVDGADAPYNPTQIGVPRGFPSSSAKKTRSVTSDRLSSGKIRPLEKVRAEIQDDARYESMVVQNAFGGKLGSKDRGGSVQRITLEDHQEAINSLDRLVVLRNDLIRSLLDGKKVPADAYIFQIDQYAYVSDEDFDLLTEIDDAIDAIHDQLSWREEQFSDLNDEIDEMRESITKLEDSFRQPRRIGSVVDFESSMQRHIDYSDGDSAEALDYMKRDAELIIDALKEIDEAEDKFSSVTHEEKIAEIKKLIDSADESTTPEEFAPKITDLYYDVVNGLESEMSDLFGLRFDYEDNGVTADREDITGKPKDVFASRNLPSSDMVEGDAQRFSSGRKKRTQGSKRRPMSDEDRQAFADGVRQRAATIPGKKKPAPSKDEFDSGSLGSGRFSFPDSTKRRRIGEQISAATSIKVGKLSENNDRSPDGKWMLDASKLKLILKDENGQPLDTAEIAALMGISKEEAEKFNAPGAAISEADAATLVDRMFFNGSNPIETDSTVRGIWGFDSRPYWYDSRRGNQLSREEYADYMDEGIGMYGILSPEGFEETEEFVARETTRGGFELSTLADALGAKSGAEIAEALTFEVDGERITPTEVQIKKWKRSGIPTGIIEQLVESGVIPNAGDIFGEDGVEFDNSIKQFDLWKKVSDAIAKAGIKAKGSELDDVIGATKVQTRLKTFEKDGGVKFSKNVGKALRYNDDEVREIVDRLNKKFGLNETVESIKGGPSMSSGRRAARRISNTGNQAAESLSSGRKNNGAPENITPRMQNELIGWAENARWSGFAQSVFSQFKAKGFLTPTQWTRLLQLNDNSRKRR